MYTKDQIETLSPEQKRAALAGLLKIRVAEPRSYPLSLAQEGMWFQQQLEPRSPAYSLPLVFCIRGPLQVEMLQQSFDSIVRRHQVLRSVFKSEHGKPMQHVLPWQPVQIPIRDLNCSEDTAWKPQVLQLSHEQSREPIDLITGPIFRIELVRVSETLHALLICIHHIVMDGWAIGVLLRELSETYLALASGNASPLSALQVQYSDFVHWQSRKLQASTIESQVAYWKTRLQDAPAALELPTDFPRPPVQTYRGATYAFVIPAELAERLKSVGRDSGATFFMTLLASFYVLLARLSGQDDIVLGASVANRQRKEYGDLIGLFANTAPMRANLQGDPTFLQFLERVRTDALQDYANTDIPLARIVEELKPVRDPARNVLFQAGFDFQNWPWPVAVGDAVTLLDGDSGAAKLDLNLSLSSGTKALSGAFEYSTDLFTANTIRQFTASFLCLLESIAANPRMRISELGILGDSERRLVVETWNQTSSPYPANACIHELFEQQARRTPDAVALIQGKTQWTYSELETRSNRLAGLLREAGVAAESRVGLCAERSPELIAALLAVLKAGGCYVPLDPALPPDRLAYILDDARAGVLLTTRKLASILPALNSRILYLDADDTNLDAGVGHIPTETVTPANLAYLIYTSGSTGRPKGVMVTHASLVNYACAAGAEFSLTSSDRVLQFASLSFDASAEEIFPCLIHGATLVLRTDDMLSSPAAFLEACTHQQISLLDLPTAYWHELVTSLTTEDSRLPATLRLVIIGGEAASPDTVSTWLKHAPPGIRLLNTYGPTEATIVATSMELSASSSQVSIGRPIRNVQAYVVDQHLQPVPPGVYGEILLGGTGIARGYLDRPDLTADKFVPDAFSDKSGARLYRTGDIGRHLPTGELEFKGRLDGQIKLRGFRIELGELEAALRRHPGVNNALVLVRESRPGDRRLIAFVVRHRSHAVLVSDVREWMRQQLPEYMVPAAFVLLDDFPMTVSGKVDRQALLALAPETIDLGRTVTAPRTPSEELMAGIWAEVLGLDKVGVYDNFFELGGHSLLATQVLSRIRRVMHVDVPLYSLFEAPTIARFVQVIEANRWSEGGLVPPPIAPLPRPQSGDSTFVQSFAQQRLWFLEQLEPNTATYNIPSGVRLEGELDLPALEASLNEIIRRHEVLRTTFHQEEEKPLQVIEPHLTLANQVIDLSALPGNTREEEVLRLANAEAHRPFDVAQGPLMRMQVLKLGDHEHILLLTMHHIVSDAWSIGVLVQELAALYPAFHSGEPSPLRDLNLQYADFAAWQRDWLSGDRLEQQVQYWRKQLEHAPAFLQLPTDRQSPPIRSLGGASVYGSFDKALMESMKAFSRSHNVTPFMTLLSAFNALLYRYSGQTDILVGTPIANRHREELEPLIGFFVNTLVMRADLSGNPAFRDLVGQVRETALGAYAHQDLPFERLVEQLGPDRRWSGTPLFRVMFVLQNAPMPPLDLPGLVVSSIALENRTTKFDLTLEVVEHPNGMTVTFQYSTDLFEEATVQRMVEHYRQLLEGAVQNPAMRLSELPLLTGHEQRQWVEGWNETPRLEASTESLSIQALFEQQVDRTPEHLAVAGDQQQLSYAELDSRANQLAQYLVGLGIRPEMRVGICLRRSVSMLVGVLGILKAGAAYLPLDPTYPTERLAFTLEDGQVSVLLTEEKLLAALPPHSARTLLLDRDWPLIAACSAERPQVTVKPENLAYLIYTSGSTGRPKGVMIEQRNCVTFLRWVHTVFSPEELACVLASTSLCFDLSIFELFAPLSVGGSIRMVPNALELSPTEPVTLLNTVPSILTELLRFQPLPPTLRTINLAGEPLPSSLARAIHEQAPQVRLLNLYGPSEDTTYSTFYELKPESAPWIGKPIANTQAYVLDEALQLVPVGVMGEIYLAGDGLARGYLERPDLTAERFLPNPFAHEPGSRMYRTGDRARIHPDGNLDCLGRVDNQVKIRGCRIELGEIEAVLSQHPGVRNTAVVVRLDQSADPRLVAYVEAGQTQKPSADDLRQAIKQRLPEFMVPSVFIFLDSLPQTLNGKIDRNALPVPEIAFSTSSYLAPRTKLEESLCRIWADVLQRERVGVEENFFELGGHSLRATQVVSRIRKTLQLEIPLHAMFEEPTVGGIAQGIENKRWETGSRLPAPLLVSETLQDATGTRVLPQSSAQQRLWFHDQLEPDTAIYTIPHAVRLRGELNLAALRESLNQLVQRHEALRTTFGLEEDQPVQIIAPKLELEIPLIDLVEVEAQQFLYEEAQRSFNLAQGPLLRVILIRIAASEHILVLNIHHIITDGWSMGVLVRELSALYGACCQARPNPLPALTLNASDFYARQQVWLNGGALESQLSYWQKRLKGAPSTLPLPADHPLTSPQKGATLFTLLPPSLAEAAKLLGRENGATLFMVLLAAFKTLLHRYTGQTDMVVGTPIANRHWEEVEHLVGHLTNAIALRTDLAQDPSFRELLNRVRETAVGAYSNQDVPFEKLIEQLGPERTGNRTPLFNVMFVLQNAPMPPLELPGLEPTQIGMVNRTTMFDLTLEVVEHSFGMVAAFQYSTELFEEATVQRMVEHYRQLLEGAVNNPEMRLSELPLLTEHEQRQWMQGWNETPRLEAPSEPLSIQALFEQQVDRTPQNLAVADDQQQLSYAELDSRANQLAQYLVGLGVGPEMRVGVCLRRSTSMLVGVLAILKSGPAYLPLDPTYPAERLAFMLEDGQVSVLLTEEKLLATLPPHSAHTLLLDKDWPVISAYPAERPQVIVKPENLAYLIYTSGSTGRPKGVMIEQRNCVTFLRWVHTVFAPEELACVLASTSLCFDLSIFELFAPLTVGGSVRIVPNALELSPTEPITLLNTVPSILTELLRSQPLPPTLRTINLAGEPLPSSLARTIHEQAPQVRVLNLYGPSEDTTYSTYYDLTGESQRVPFIGKPIANTQAYVLDETLQLVPIGIMGEIYLAGDGLARGYLERPELTAERFLPNPFSRESGSRMYRTGDRGRIHADGNLECLGRVDNQVKIHGCRIELGEIEAVLSQHPGVRNTAVTVHQDQSSDPRLVAYVETSQTRRPSAEELRQAIKQRLPDFMVPSTFVFLDALPQTLNGKIDRKALPAPIDARRPGKRETVAPQTPAEELLCEIWSGLLNVQPLGIHDNFFELGGHSLLATQIISRIRRALQLDLSLRQFFGAPTVHDLLGTLAEIAGSRADVEDMAQTYLEIARLSEEEASNLLLQDA